MRNEKTFFSGWRSRTGSTLFWVLILYVFLFPEFCPHTIEAAWEPILAPMPKTVPLGFQEGFMLEPNVLLLLDTSGSMTFRSEDDTTTRGDGSRPAFERSGRQYPTRGVYFGQDMDLGWSENNNDPLDPDNYHPLLRYIDVEEVSADWPQRVFTTTLSEFDQLDTWLKDILCAKDNEGRYLFPNDSRMYKLKLVLWRILNDPSLVSNLRMGLATYFQNEGYAESDWYEFPYRYYGNWYWGEQDTYWTAGDSTNYALLREGFSSTNEQDHLKSLRNWVDGAEYSGIPDYGDNPELRADGNTPLASSIYNTSARIDCAYDFFEEDDVIQGWCQDNYLIVLTDGADTDPNISDHLNTPVNRVQMLYEQSQNIGVFFERPNRPVKTLVIGFVDPDSEEGEIEDLKYTLNRMADVGWDGEIDNNGPRGEGTSDQAYFANDVDALLQAFSDIFVLIQQKSGTAGAPLISPGSKTGEETGSVYVASFIPKPTDQWEGKFYKYDLEPTGISGTPVWEAGAILNSRAYSSRNVFTVDWNGDTNLVNFTDSEIALKTLALQNDRLEILPSMSDADWEAFVRWVLGSAEYDPGVSHRWKLSDIYHSGLTEVGPPQALTPQGGYDDFILANSSRDKIVYVQANDGMLHAFNSETSSDDHGNIFTAGDERWAFIPPNVIHSARLIGLRGSFTKEPGELWQFNPLDGSDTRSIPRYLLDGPLVAEDVYDASAGQWKTVLVGLTGYAGAGVYCIEVTDPDNPEFMWSIENAVYKPDGGFRTSDKQRALVHWTPHDSGPVSYDFYRHHESVPPELDYRDLRFTLSVPVIGNMTLNDVNGDTVTKWVSLMGNGTDMKLSGDSVGGCVFVTDIFTGEIVNTFKFEPNMKFVVSPVTVLRENDIRRISTFYVGDNNGDIYEACESDNWSGRKIINLNGSNGPSYRMEVGLFGNYTPWLFIITGDQDENVVYGSNYNHVVAVNTRYSPNSSLVMTSDLTEVDPDNPLSVSPALGAGWYFRLDGREYPSTPIKLYSGYLFYSTFIEDPDPCKIGTSRIYVQQAKTGMGGWQGYSKFMELPGIQVRGITISEGRVYVGAIDHSGTGVEGLPDELSGLGATFENNLLVFDTPPSVTAFPFPIESGQMIPRYWREWIKR